MYAGRPARRCQNPHLSNPEPPHMAFAQQGSHTDGRGPAAKFQAQPHRPWPGFTEPPERRPCASIGLYSSVGRACRGVSCGLSWYVARCDRVAGFLGVVLRCDRVVPARKDYAWRRWGARTPRRCGHSPSPKWLSKCLGTVLYRLKM